MTFVGRTFGTDSWRRVAYAAVAAPVGLVALLLGLVGARHRAYGLQRRVTGRLIGSPERPHERLPGTLAYAVVSLPLGVVGLWLALMLVPNTLRNLLYGVFVGDGYRDAWGGPTLAGAWAVHAGLALALVPVGLWLVRGLTGLQRRLADGLLGTGRVGVGTGVTCSVLLVAAGVFLTAWVHQV